MYFTPIRLIYYKQPIKFLVFVAGTCNLIFLFVLIGTKLETFVFCFVFSILLFYTNGNS